MDRVFEECREAALKGYRQDGLRAPRRRVARPEMIPRPIVVPASSSAEPGRPSPNDHRWLQPSRNWHVRRPITAPTSPDAYDVRTNTLSDDDCDITTVDVAGPTHDAEADLTYRPDRYSPPGPVEQAYQSARRFTGRLAGALPRMRRFLSRTVEKVEGESPAGDETAVVRPYEAHGWNGVPASAPPLGSVGTRLWGFVLRETLLITSALGWVPSEARLWENETMDEMIDAAFDICCRRPAWATNVGDEENEDDPSDIDMESFV